MKLLPIFGKKSQLEVLRKAIMGMKISEPYLEHGEMIIKIEIQLMQGSNGLKIYDILGRHFDKERIQPLSCEITKPLIFKILTPKTPRQKMALNALRAIQPNSPAK